MSAQQTSTDTQSQTGIPEEISYVPAGTSRVSCDGGGDALGHPRIWLTLTDNASGGAEVTCPYCSRRFVSA